VFLPVRNAVDSSQGESNKRHLPCRKMSLLLYFLFLTRLPEPAAARTGLMILGTTFFSLHCYLIWLYALTLDFGVGRH
jgi:hypothetical protein